MPEIVFYCLDLETTGIDPRRQEICELSIIRASDRVQLTRQVKVDHPENASYDALQIIGKSMNDLRSGVSKLQLIKDFENFLFEDKLTPSYRCLVGHNIIQFDKRWLQLLWERYQKQFPFNLYLDTIHLFRDYAKQVNLANKKANLGAACEALGIIKRGKAHSAKSDIQNTYFLWQALIQKMDYLKYIKQSPHYLKGMKPEEEDFSQIAEINEDEND